MNMTQTYCDGIVLRIWPKSLVITITIDHGHHGYELWSWYWSMIILRIILWPAV